MSNVLPTVVVGAGPSGIETAIELRRRGVDAHVFDAGPLGHTISWWAPGTRWFSSNDRIAIAGVPLNTVDQAKASREEYLNYLRSVVDQFAVPVNTFHRLVSISPIGDQAHDADNRWRLGFRRTLGEASASDKRTTGQSTCEGLAEAEFFVDAHAVVLAVGGTDFPNRLGVPGEELPHVDGYLREIHRYHGRRVLIVGGRNSAVEAAIRLHRGGANVSLCYHREQLPSDGIKYWLRPEIEGLIRSGSIQSYFGARVAEITPSTVTLRAEDLDDAQSRTTIDSDDVLTLIGYRQDQSLFEQLGIVSDSSSGSPLFDAETMETEREGIYVAGTAVGGTQSSHYQVFLENCHDHPRKIADHLCGTRATLPEVSERETLEARDAGLRRRIAWQPES
ncbi:NAD(P)-binding domain-containing protein [Allorhodopirellula heiligendammensis]|uniref:NAD(P)-binding domain-containing protein n=1 Tax=Allorhodopirellula heiligendammensis TaxID=2714739 RepID=UPI0011B78DE8|nr:NAD(P)-binding domain-containing protein [Allorhodopirellula heiligendammensis]